MTAAHFVPERTTSAGPRWLLLSSLALNLFFIGIAIAMAVRPAPPQTGWDPDVFVRVERVAATLPPADADLLQGLIRASHTELDTAQATHQQARAGIRTLLRAEPYDPAALRAAMTRSREAREAFDAILQGVFAQAADKMSPAGRKAVADWSPTRKTASNP